MRHDGKTNDSHSKIRFAHAVRGNGQSHLVASPRGSGQTVIFLFAAPVSVPTPQGYLGVDLHDVTEDRVSLLKMKDSRGAEITLVDHDGPAGKAGLREHDVVVEMDGQPVSSGEQMRRMLRDSAPGKTIMLTICRDGMMMAITAQMANRQQVERQAWEQRTTIPEPVYPLAFDNGNNSGASSADAVSPAPAMRGGNSFMGRMSLSSSSTGVVLMKMSKQIADSFGVQGNACLLVWSVETTSPAGIAGMRAGDVLMRVDARGISSTSEWSKALSSAKGRAMSVVVLRDKREVTLVLVPDRKKHSEVVWPTIGSEPAPIF